MRKGRGGRGHTDGAGEHRDHSEPGVGQVLGDGPPVADAQHVRHGLEQRPRVLLGPAAVLREMRCHERMNACSTLMYSITVVRS